MHRVLCQHSDGFNGASYENSYLENLLVCGKMFQLKTIVSTIQMLLYIFLLKSTVWLEICFEQNDQLRVVVKSCTILFYAVAEYSRSF